MNSLDSTNYKLTSIYKTNIIYIVFCIIANIIFFFIMTIYVADRGVGTPNDRINGLFILCLLFIIIYNLGHSLTKYIFFKVTKIIKLKIIFSAIIDIYPKDFITKRIYLISELIFYPIALFSYNAVRFFYGVNFKEDTIYNYLPLIIIFSYIISFKLPVFLKILFQSKDSILKVNQISLEIYNKI